VVLVGVQRSEPGLYFPPELKVKPFDVPPPQTTISMPVQTAVCLNRPGGALAVFVSVQLSIDGRYFPPVFKFPGGSGPPPPQTIISLPVHTAV